MATKKWQLTGRQRNETVCTKQKKGKIAASKRNANYQGHMNKCLRKN